VKKWTLFLVAGFLPVAPVLPAQDDSIEKLIGRLRSDTIEIREKASKALLAKGVEVVASLEPLKKDADEELAGRVRELLAALARKSFERVETAMYGVNTLRVRISGTGAISHESGSERRATSGTILIGLIDKANISLKTEAGKAEAPELLEIVCDGFDVFGRAFPKADPKVWSAPSNFKEGLLAVLFLVGEEPLCDMIGRWYTARTPEQRPNPRKTCVVSDLAVRKESARCETLSFRIEGPEVPRGTASVRLTYDAATCVLVKRVLTTVDDDGRPSEYTETFEEFAINADIPEEKFKLPEEKK
jgi:hypothetical protein